MMKEKSLRIIVVLFLVFAFLGFLDATYLTAKHFLDSPVTCTLLEGCEVVTTSQYSEIFGIPVALLGLIYYLLIFVLVNRYRETGVEKFLIGASRFTIFGLLASVWFIFVQAVLLKAFCIYCLLSAITSITLFVIGIITLKRLRNKISL
jgi:uncharacterized membrane protein